MSGGQLKVNGRRITVAGANRHEHDDRGGKVVPLESMVRDVLLMKRFNFNAVRTSHYPNHPFFYEARYINISINRVLILIHGCNQQRTTYMSSCTPSAPQEFSHIHFAHFFFFFCLREVWWDFASCVSATRYKIIEQLGYRGSWVLCV